MPKYILPDSSIIESEAPLTGRALAERIGARLAREAIGVVVGETLLDLGRPLPEGTVRVITATNADPQALWLLRHSCAHILAEAVCKLFPGTRLAYGPPIDDGFYYDMATPKPITSEDFAAIEAEMARIVAEDRPFTRVDYAPDAGLARTGNDKYKRDNAERALAKGASTLSYYATGKPGESWEDLCAGPHVPSTRWLKAHKVMSVAGAYWHGDQNSDQLTRIYGTCFADAKGLSEHLTRLEEAKKRDHRRIGKEMDLFHLQDDNPGQVFWHPKGWSIYRALEEYIRAKIRTHGYVEVKTPQMMSQSLWLRSGHWDKFKENMFITSSEERQFALKPMNCPGHIEIFRQGLRSYRDLPLRMAEFGSCIRNGLSGALHGIMRCRGFVQDDAHIFCTEAQISSEVADFCALLKEVYADFGFGEERILVRFSTRPEKRVGSDATWDHAEAALADACKHAKLTYVVAPGEGAFYGPKLEFTLYDSLGRAWQCGTIQVDYQLPSKERLDAEYVGEDGQKHHPVILHRAVLGSMERFIGILIEHFAGKLPLWLAPEQLRILPITDAQIPYATTVAKSLGFAGMRVSVDGASEKLGAKVRKARTDRVSYFGVVGAQEVTDGTVALQSQAGEKLGNLAVAALVERLQSEIAARRAPAAAGAAAT